MNEKWKISSDPKKICFITIIIVALGGLLWYFRPLPLSNLANDSIQILATEIEYVVKDDMAYHNVTNYTEISDVQKTKSRLCLRTILINEPWVRSFQMVL